MPSARIPKPIALTVANAHEGATVTAYNRTTGETTTATVASGKAVIDLQNLASGYTTGDIIEFRVAGAYFGRGTVTTTSPESAPQSLSISLTQTSTTNAPGIFL